MTVSEPAPSSVPAGWWEYISPGDGAGPNAIMAGGESSAQTARKETSAQNLEQRLFSRRAPNWAPKQECHQVGPGSIRRAGLGQWTNAG